MSAAADNYQEIKFKTDKVIDYLTANWERFADAVGTHGAVLNGDMAFINKFDQEFRGLMRNLIASMLGMFIENLLKFAYTMGIFDGNYKSDEEFLKSEIEMLKYNRNELDNLYDIEKNYADATRFHKSSQSWLNEFKNGKGIKKYLFQFNDKMSFRSSVGQQLDTDSRKMNQLNKYLSDKTFYSLFRDYLERLMAYSIARSLHGINSKKEKCLSRQGMKSVNGDISSHEKRCAMHCFNFLEGSNIKLWLEMSIQFRYSNFGMYLNGCYKDNSLKTNIEFRPTNVEKFRRKKGEIDIITNDAMCEIKFKRNFTLLEMKKIMNNNNHWADPKYEVRRDKFYAIDAMNCKVYQS